MNNKWILLVVSQGFYYFGIETTAPEGYIALKKCSMSGGFNGGKGIGGVCRETPDAKITLDRMSDDDDDVSFFPLSAVLGIHPAVDMEKHKGVTWRK